MFPATFAYIRAESVPHALALLKAHGDGARLLAGGHSLIPAMKLRLARPEILIDIGRLAELQEIRAESTHLVVGALATHVQIETSALLAAKAPALYEAARSIGDMQVRNRGTIGGALAHADPSADYPAALLALGAEAVAVGPQGRRTIPLESFFCGPFTTALQSEEILTEVRVPMVADGAGSAFLKFARRATDYGVASVGAWLQLDHEGRCTAIRVGISCVALQPYRAHRVEAALLQKRLTPVGVAAAAELATEGVVPMDDAYTPGEYRLHMAQVLVRRAITEATLRAQQMLTAG